jgi:hypothetical protein
MYELELLKSIGSCLISLALWVGWMVYRDRVKVESAIKEVQEVEDPSGRDRPCYLVHLANGRTVHITGAQAWYVSDGDTYPEAVALARRARRWLDGSDDRKGQRKKLSQEALDEVIHGSE